MRAADPPRRRALTVRTAATPAPTTTIWERASGTMTSWSRLAILYRARESIAIIVELFGAHDVFVPAAPTTPSTAWFVESGVPRSYTRSGGHRCDRPCGRCRPRGALPPRGARRARRHVHRLRGHRPAAAPHGRGQDHGRPPGARPDVRRPVHPGGPRRGHAQPHQR